MTETPILQFGTSRFLQAHADLFFTEGAPFPTVTVVQSSGDPERARRLAGLADPSGFVVRIRGVRDGRTVDEERRVTSVRRALSTATDWAQVERIGSEEACVILSNVGDGGYATRPADASPVFDQAMSYPAKLCRLLLARLAAGAPPPLVMPTELVPRNGDVLKARVLEIARATGASDSAIDFIEETAFARSLVDRIVSQSLEPAGAVAEPYALWAIEGAPGVAVPCAHEAVRLVDDLERVARLKLHILNLGHTVLVDLWRQAGSDPSVAVRDLVDTAAFAELQSIYDEEVLPGFAHKGWGEEARSYRETTVERFCNPFLDHRLTDIADNHPTKAERRIDGFIQWVGPEGPPMPRLAAAARRARG